MSTAPTGTPMSSEAAPMNASVLIVIVNYATGHLVVDCLRSLEAELKGFKNARVQVVNNPSGDDSVHVINSAIQENGWAFAEVLEAPKNGGFAYGNNFAARPALASVDAPDFIWLLNPDTQARPGALTELVRFCEQHPEAGIVGSSIEEDDGKVWPYAFRFPSFLSELDEGARLGLLTRALKKHTVIRKMSDAPERVDWLPGASMLVRREVFDAVGLMDEGYFLYYEETDFCLQASRAGFQTWYVPASRVMHIAGQSTGVTAKSDQPKRLPEYWFESRTRYFLKNHGRAYGAVTDLARATAFSTWSLRRLILSKDNDAPPHYLGDLLKKSALLSAKLPGNRRLD